MIILVTANKEKISIFIGARKALKIGIANQVHCYSVRIRIKIIAAKITAANGGNFGYNLEGLWKS